MPSVGVWVELKNEKWFDHQAVMNILKVSRKSVDRYCALYRLKSSRIGQRRYFSETALLQLFKDHEKL
jgi:hypothetical protein